MTKRPSLALEAPLLLLAALVAHSGCASEDAGPDFGFETGPLMRPGDDCSRCHGERSDYPTAPRWTLGGTVFERLDGTEPAGIAGVHVLLSAPDGAVVETLVTNAVGNFYTATELPLGYRVTLERGGARVAMPCPPPAGNCAACHSAPAIGGALGRIYAPGGGPDPKEYDCEAWEPVAH